MSLRDGMPRARFQDKLELRVNIRLMHKEIDKSLSTRNDSLVYLHSLLLRMMRTLRVSCSIINIIGNIVDVTS